MQHVVSVYIGVKNGQERRAPVIKSGDVVEMAVATTSGGFYSHPEQFPSLRLWNNLLCDNCR